MILPFIVSFVPCSFGGLEMAMFTYLAKSVNARSATVGVILGISSIFLMSYVVYLALPILITDTSEQLMRYLLGAVLLTFATIFLWRDYPSPKGALLTAALGVAAEGVEVNLFEISSYLMTGDLTLAFLGGTLGFSWVLASSTLLFRKFPRRLMRVVSISTLYVMGFVVLTSGLV
ncbi:MAG: hypothetical protein QXY37_04440 [Metallosphaera sp.]